MKKIKVFWNGVRLRDMYPHASWFQVFKWKTLRFIRKAVIISFVGGMVLGAFKLGTMTSGEISYAAPKEVEVHVKAPILERIATCESGNSHYDKNGQVLINNSHDMGVFQINVPIWGKKASEMGLDLSVEKDNRQFAQYLYENFGTEPWVHSKKCWVK